MVTAKLSPLSAQILMNIDFTDIEVVEENECDLCGRWMEAGEEIQYSNASCFDEIYICARCYEEVQRGQAEPLEM